MKNRILKGFFGFAVFSIMSLSFSIIGHAESYTDLNLSAENTEVIAEGTRVEVDEAVIARMAIDVAMSMQEKNLVVSDIIPILDINGDVVSYDVSFTYDGVDHGYVVLDFRLEDYVSEFNFSEGAKSVYFSLLERNNIDESTISNSDLEIVETVPTEYNVEVNDTVVSTTGENYSIDEFQEVKEDTVEIAEEIIEENDAYESTSSKYDHASKFIIDYPASYKMTSSNYLSFFNAITEPRVKKVSGRYACAVSTMATIASSYELFNANNDAQLKAAYTSLWDYSGTSVINTSNGINYGDTKVNMIGPALQRYTASKGVNISYNNYTSPTFSTVSTAIKAKQPVALNVFYTKNNGQVSGHTVFVQGIMSGTSGGNYHNFVVVYDGWTDGAKYINYSTKYFEKL